MVSEFLEISAVAIFVAISLRPRSVTIIIPYFVKAFLSGEGFPSPDKSKNAATI